LSPIDAGIQFDLDVHGPRHEGDRLVQPRAREKVSSLNTPACTPSSQPIRGDPVQSGQILTNLIVQFDQIHGNRWRVCSMEVTGSTVGSTRRPGSSSGRTRESVVRDDATRRQPLFVAGVSRRVDQRATTPVNAGNVGLPQGLGLAISKTACGVRAEEHVGVERERGAGQPFWFPRC